MKNTFELEKQITVNDQKYVIYKGKENRIIIFKNDDGKLSLLSYKELKKILIKEQKSSSRFQNLLIASLIAVMLNSTFNPKDGLFKIYKYSSEKNISFAQANGEIDILNKVSKYDEYYYKKDIQNIDYAEFYEAFRNIINNNENLPSNIKNFILGDDFYKCLIYNHGKYMDQRSVLKKFKKLKVLFKEDIDDSFRRANPTSSGRYNNSKNTIYLTNISRNDNLNDICNKEILLHETLHVFQGGINEVVGKSLYEALCEQTILVYSGIDNTKYQSTAYKKQRICLEMIDSIVGTDALLKFSYQKDIIPLIQTLINIYGDEEDAIRLISSIDEMLNAELLAIKLTVEKRCDIKEYPKCVDNMYKSIDIFISKYSPYFETKYHRTIDKDFYTKCAQYFLYDQNIAKKSYFPSVISAYENSKCYPRLTNVKDYILDGTSNIFSNIVLLYFENGDVFYLDKTENQVYYSVHDCLQAENSFYESDKWDKSYSYDLHKK